MRPSILLFTVLVSVIVSLSYGVKVVRPATCGGRLTGHLTFDEEILLSRTKRQGRRPRPPGRRRTARPTTAAPAVTTEAPAVTTGAPAVTTGAPAVTTGAPAVTTGAPAVTTAAASTASSETPEATCDSLVYRTADGSCNNLKYNWRGSADQAFVRAKPAEYNVLTVGDEKVYSPRRYSDVTQAELPNVRVISRFIHDPDNRPSGQTVMSMQWGQFLDHDITATPVNPSNKTCCSSDLVLNNQQHEDVSINGPCFPIIIPDNDPHFTAVENRCMENKRSYQRLVDGIPEQVNLISAFIDGSQVYGSSDSTMTALRSSEKGPFLHYNSLRQIGFPCISLPSVPLANNGRRVAVLASVSIMIPGETNGESSLQCLGRLDEIDNNLPEGSSTSCIIDQGRDDVDYCLLAGDSRVNVYPGLAATHTVFMRMHNVLADGLSAKYPDWDDETVFQEARRINVALLQKITYTEWLRVILGTDAVSLYRLESGNYAYEEETDPTLANVFSTAAFRFGHSMIPDGLVINELFYESLNLFNNPRYVLHSLDSLTQGLLTNVSQRVDRWYSTGMTNHMFETSAFNGLDIVSLNIQRGRDHGLAPYNKWREHCNFSPFLSFDDMGGGGRRFSQVFGHVDDIDLYSGALEERPVAGGMVGETYACIIGQQFEALKFGDRFWYENADSPTPFTTNQIREIERQTLGSVLCQTTGIQSVQRNVFRTVDPTNNPSTNCVDVNTINFDMF